MTPLLRIAGVGSLLPTRGRGARRRPYTITRMIKQSLTVAP